MEPGTKGTSQHLLVAALLMTLGAAINALDSVIVRHLTAELHPFQIGFFRALFGLIAVSPYILKRPAGLRSNYRFLHALRAALKLVSLVSGFAAVAVAPLADVTAILFSTPLFITLGALLFLGERLDMRRIVAVGAGFLGVLIIISPGARDVTPALLLAVVSALASATIQVMLKAMSARDRTDTLVSWNLILTVPLALVPALLFWQPLSLENLLLLAFQGAAGALSMTAMTYAMSQAPASYLAPFSYLRLPMVAILAFAFFQETVGMNTWLGAAVIFAATLMLVGRRPFGFGGPLR